uniref:Uncharacterized protein n=1 Tax=Romanomermis culicivorax TaxID=13658 RepID=A0A915KBE1_ROMCU
MAFHAQISDPIVGGTYMTLMNTVSNLGGNWPVTFLLSIVDRFTWKECLKGDATSTPLLSLGPCDNETVCQASGGRCQVTLDGYYILSVVCACVGFLWWRLMKRRLDRLQRLDKSSWTLAKMGR